MSGEYTVRSHSRKLFVPFLFSTDPSGITFALRT
jgi:hypothetical protein